MEHFNHRHDVHNISTRNNSLIDVPYVRLEKTRSSHLIMGINIFNKLPQQVVRLNYNNFKNKIFNFLIDNPYYCIDEFLSLRTSDLVKLM